MNDCSLPNPVFQAIEILTICDDDLCLALELAQETVESVADYASDSEFEFQCEVVEVLIGQRSHEC